MPLVVHCPGPLPEAWEFFTEAVRTSATPCRHHRESATFLTWNNGLRPDKPNGLIEECFSRYGCEILVLGRGVMPWNNVDKLRMTADALVDAQTEYVVGLDSGDILIVDHPDEIVRRFRQHFTCDLIFNATGSACWPELPQYVMFERSIPSAFRSQGRCWLNAGAFVGRTDFCRRYFAEVAKYAELNNAPEDQSAIKATWPQWYPQVQIDDQCLIFQWFNESRETLQILRDPVDRQRQLIEWLRDVHPLCWGAEVGVLDGYTSDILLQSFPKLNLWMIDRWEPFVGSGLDFLDEDGFERLRRMTLWWTSHAPSRRFELRRESTVAANFFAENSLDFVFIDADHTYEAVKRDLLAWWPRVRPGGLVCGHDYGVYGDASGQWGVSRAVNEFALAQQTSIAIGLDGTWRLVRSQ